MNVDPKVSTISRPSVLVVDDDPVIQVLFKQALAPLNYDVVSASSGREALQQMMQHNFDVLLVDIGMPEMDGTVFLQEALTIWPWTGVVVVSGFLKDEILDKLRPLGVTRFLHKPVNLSLLCENVAAAAAERPKPTDRLPSESLLALMRGQLQMLSSTEGVNLRTGLLADTLQDFVRDLAHLLPCQMLGLLVVEEENQCFLVHLRRSVPPEFIARVRADMLARYNIISGRTLDEKDVETRIDGKIAAAEGPDHVGATLSVPVILEGNVCAMLTLARHEQKPYGTEDVSLLYLAANHVAAVSMALRRMRHLAMRDVLTDLYSRQGIEEQLEQAWQTVRRYGQTMAVVVLDIDHFKVMNDTYGHAVGDLLLRDFAALMREAGRASDILGRFGGDEFMAILPHTSMDEARIFCERILQRTRRQVFCPDSHHLALTVSIGVAGNDNESCPIDAMELLSQADRALYRAKRMGRNRISVWQEESEKKPAEPRPVGNAKDAWQPNVSEKARAHLLMVDADAGSLESLGETLTGAGYDTHAFRSNGDALATVEASPGVYDLVLIDIDNRTPRGLTILDEFTATDPLLIPVVISKHASVDVVVECMRKEVVDFLVKPIDPRQLLATVRRAMACRQLKLENAHYQRHLEQMVEQRSAQLQRTLNSVKQSYEFTMEALMEILDARSQHMGRHSLRVREMAIWLAQRMNLNGRELREIATGALLHDIGKIATPDRILLSTGRFSEEERKIMQQHAEMGARILAGSRRLAGAARVVVEHHERFDGTGYPKGLRGEQISLGARIFALVDTYDAMRSDRMYRAAVSEADTVAEIVKERGKQFDPAVVDVFLQHRDAFASMYRRLCRDQTIPPSIPAG